MGKILVIKGANFSTNALENINIEDDKPFVVTYHENEYLWGGQNATTTVVRTTSDSSNAGNYIWVGTNDIMIPMGSYRIDIPTGYKIRPIISNTGKVTNMASGIDYISRGDNLDVRTFLVDDILSTVQSNDKSDVGAIEKKFTYSSDYKYWSINISRVDGTAISLSALIAAGFKIEKI